MQLIPEKIKEVHSKKCVDEKDRYRVLYVLGEGENSGIKSAIINDSFIAKTHSIAKMISPIEVMTWLKTETVLPAWLEKELFSKNQYV